MGTAGLLLVHSNTSRKNYYHSSTISTTAWNWIRKISYPPISISLLNSNRKPHHYYGLAIRTLRCCSNSASTPKPRGFGSPPPHEPKPAKRTRDDKTPVLPPRCFLTDFIVARPVSNCQYFNEF
ncbi:hypothetical protein M9H77_00796 [Catharanthus roseus]|uniref:Uncharacterized protein n=1 Tax=Catharanthus roseus TaxID=4058 RepID=A0ACC0C3V1_CATRO|nr:hypothetical protein M9H77_00796 [Catharanthus roseus]